MVLGVPVLIPFAVWNVALVANASVAIFEKAVTCRMETIHYRDWTEGSGFLTHSSQAMACVPA